MKCYEIAVERATPCGGTKYAIREILEAVAASPESYVREHGRFPILEEELRDGQTVIVNRNTAGYRDTYFFTEL